MSNLVLIGPQNVGKSSTARWISSNLNIPYRSLDDRDQPWFRDNQPAYQEMRRTPQHDPNHGRLFKLVEAVSVQDCLTSVDGAVIDFGAGHSVYDDPTQFDMVRSALEGHRVVLLLPSINVEISRAFMHDAYSGQNQPVIPVKNQPSVLVQCRTLIPIRIRSLIPGQIRHTKGYHVNWG